MPSSNVGVHKLAAKQSEASSKLAASLKFLKGMNNKFVWQVVNPLNSYGIGPVNFKVQMSTPNVKEL